MGIDWRDPDIKSRLVLTPLFSATMAVDLALVAAYARTDGTPTTAISTMAAAGVGLLGSHFALVAYIGRCWYYALQICIVYGNIFVWRRNCINVWQHAPLAVANLMIAVTLVGYSLGLVFNLGIALPAVGGDFVDGFAEHGGLVAVKVLVVFNTLLMLTMTWLFFKTAYINVVKGDRAYEMFPVEYHDAAVGDGAAADAGGGDSDGANGGGAHLATLSAGADTPVRADNPT